MKWMFAQAAAGQVPSEIAKGANVQGWKTKVRFRPRSEKVRGGNAWTARQVVATLRNPVYTGAFQERGGTRAGCHEAIIGELFAAVGEQLISRRTRVPGAVSYGYAWLLTGLIWCTACERPMTPHSVRHGNHIYCYYRCRSTTGGWKPCDAQVGAHAIELAVLRELKISRWDIPDREKTRALIETICYDNRSGMIRMGLRSALEDKTDGATAAVPPGPPR